MGIYIPDMEMPKYGCDNCFLRTGNYCGRIEKDERVVEYARKNERNPDCPLVPVPPHGRLIDADALEYGEAYLNGHYELGDFEIVTREDIESAPTIIEAEEEY